jgi:hypothetical protein
MGIKNASQSRDQPRRRRSRDADLGARADAGRGSMNDAVTLRRAETRDDAALRRLAALDSGLPLAAPVLVADLDGQLLAAISLADGVAIADPFKWTAELVELLRARERQLRTPSRPRHARGVRAWVHRRAPAIG